MKLNRELIFRWSLFIKAFDAAVEIIVGVSLLLINPETITKAIQYYVQDELLEEPNNRIANYFLRHGHISAHQATYTSILLLLRGIVKLLVIYGLLKYVRWVYPVAIAVFSAFAIVEFYTFTQSHSLFLLALSIFDVFVIVMTSLEYKSLLKK